MKTYLLALIYCCLVACFMSHGAMAQDTLPRVVMDKEIKDIKTLLGKWDMENAVVKADDLVRRAPNQLQAYSMRVAVNLRAGDYDMVCEDLYKSKSMGDADADGMISKYCTKWYNDFHHQDKGVLKASPDSIFEFADGTKAFVTPEKWAEFIGGVKELNKFLINNTIYPGIAKDKEISGTVYIRFVVMADGTIAKINVLTPISKYIDIEAFRVVSTMPKWKPGLKNGVAVNSLITLPVRFSLQ